MAYAIAETLFCVGRPDEDCSEQIRSDKGDQVNDTEDRAYRRFSVTDRCVTFRFYYFYSDRHFAYRLPKASLEEREVKECDDEIDQYDYTEEWIHISLTCRCIKCDSGSTEKAQYPENNAEDNKINKLGDEADCDALVGRYGGRCVVWWRLISGCVGRGSVLWPGGRRSLLGLLLWTWKRCATALAVFGAWRGRSAALLAFVFLRVFHLFLLSHRVSMPF